MKSKIQVVLAALVLFISVNAQAQSIPIEVKINPIGTLFGDPDLSAEFIVTDQIGIEPTFIVSTGNRSLLGQEYNRTGLGGMLAGKYYFNPQRGGDRFNVGLYAKYKANQYKLDVVDQINSEINAKRVALGFMAGSKFISDNNILFEFSFGLGRTVYKDAEGGNQDQDAINELLDLFVFKYDFVGRIAVGYRFGGGDMGAEAPTRNRKKKRRRR